MAFYNDLTRHLGYLDLAYAMLIYVETLAKSGLRHAQPAAKWLSALTETVERTDQNRRIR